MNKLLTKIAALSVGLAMAIGVGVAVGGNSGKEAANVDAATIGTNLVQVTSLTSGNQYVIVGNDNGYALPTNPTVSSGKVAGTAIASVPANGSGYLWTFTKSGNYWLIGDGSKYIYHSNGGNSGTNLAYGTSQATYPWSLTYSTSTQNHWTFAGVNSGTVKTRGMLVNGTNFGGYALSNETSYKFMNIYEVAATKTLSSITLGGTYDTEFTVGDTFNHTGMTVTAHYSDSTTADKTSSATWSSPDMSTAGQKTVTVSYTEGGTTKTATYGITVSAPTTPTISLSSSSFSGYTGQQFSVTATFANLTSDFAWAASGAGTISGGVSGTTGDSRDGTSTYSGTLTGAGTKTLSASGGGADTQTYTITITKTTVSLNKASTSISVGKSETLTATTNVGSVTWNSSNTSAATVSNGVVSVPSNATVGATSTITATSAVDTSVKATCTVTVAEAPLADVLTSSVIPAAAVGSSTSSWGTASTFSDYTGAVYTARFMGVSSSSFIGRLNDSTNGYIYTSTVPSNMKLKSVTIESMTASKTVGVYAQSGAYTAAPSDKSSALGTLTPSSLTYEFDSESNYNAICLRGHTSATEIGTVTIEYEALAALNSVTTSGQTTLFTAGNKWSYGGTLTAHYTGGKADATVTSSASFKYGASGINPTTAGTSITTNTTLTKAEHDGKYIYVIYTEDDITKYCSYQITVNYAAVTSVVIDVHAAEIGLNEVFDHTEVGVTVNSEYASQGYEWIVSANTVSDDYTFDESGLLSGDTEGTITLRCRSTSDNSKYDELVVTVTGDPTATFTPASVEGFVGKGTSVAFTYGNMDDTSLIAVSSSSAAVSVGAISASNDNGTVAITFVSAGTATLSISYNGGSTLDTLSVTVSADSVLSVSWNASNFDVFSGTTLTSDIDNTWLASYEMASGDEGLLEYGDYTLKLGGSAITLPHTWAAADDGKNLCIEYGGVSSSTVSVAVTQTINAVNAPNTSTDTVSWTASEAADLGSKISSQGGTDEGTISTGDYEWDYTRTLVSLANNKSDYIAFQGDTWIQLGSGNALESIEFTTSAIPGTIKSVTVVAATAGTHALTIDVGGTKYLEDEALHVYTGTAAADNPDPALADCIKTGTGSSSGAITITIAQSGSTKKAMVIRSISVTYETEGSGTTNIANVAAHKAAQRVAVKFAKAFNAAMDNTENCTTGLSSAWSTCSSAYNTFKSEAAALGSAEEAYAKNLIKYATAQYSDDSGEACIERMMKTYEICVQKHGQTAFMSDLISSSAVRPNSIIISKDTSTSIAVVVTISLVSVAAIGGYFFFRKKKEI